MLGGAFTSRLNMNLREDKHWSYGAFSFAVDARGQRLSWYRPVQTDKTKESLAEVVRELRRGVADKPVTAAEIADAKDRMVKQLAGRWETSASVAGALSEIETYGLPKDYYATYADVLRKASDADVNAAARKFVMPGAARVGRDRRSRQDRVRHQGAEARRCAGPRRGRASEGDDAMTVRRLDS